MCALWRRFEKQTKAFLPALYGAACHLMSGPAEAEATVIEVYRRAYRAFHARPDTGGLKGWLFALLWQVCLDTWRRQHAHGIPRVRPSFSPVEVSVTALQRATSDLASQEDRTVVRQAGQRTARCYAWPRIVQQILLPRLRSLDRHDVPGGP